MPRRLLLGPALALALACGDDDSGNGFPPRADGPAPVDRPAMCTETDYPAVAVTTRSVVNGTRAPSDAPLTRRQRNAIVSIWSPSLAAHVCSGTFVGARTVLTAAHCIGDFDLEVRIGEDGANPIVTPIAVVRIEERPIEDVALLQLDQPVGDGISPLPVARAGLESGVTIELAGFGQREDGRDEKRFVSSPVVRITTDRIWVDGGGRHGVCFGDSGGPALWLSPDRRRVEVLGVLSSGDGTCTDIDRYARLSRVRAFIEDRIVDPPADYPTVCDDGLTEEGACTADGGLRTCEQDVISIEPCAEGTACAWSNAHDRYLCLEQARWACGDVTQLGRCTGDVLEWCDGGVLERRDCGACGGACRRVDAEGGFGCSDQACPDVPPEGRCAQDVVEYCDADGRLRQLDCRGIGQVCELTGDGARCVVPEGLCEDIGFTGTCVDDVAVYCEGDGLRWQNCAVSDQTCDFIDDETGYFCR